MNPFSKTDLQTVIYVYDNSEVGSQVWREAGYELDARQQSTQAEMQRDKFGSLNELLLSSLKNK